jgi:hypothetical protein
MNDEYLSKRSLFKVLDQIPKDELMKTHRELSKMAQNTGEDDNQVFEVDGQEHIVPLADIDNYMTRQNEQQHLNQIRSSFPTLRSMLESRVMPEILSPRDRSEKDDYAPEDDGYYWDKNYNYEYMNPESEKRKVLGKIRK